MLRFDPNLRWLFTEVPMAERYAAAARAGFRGVEVAFPYDQTAERIRALLDDNGLELVQILSPFDWEGGERGIAALPHRRADYRLSFEKALDFATRVGKPLIHVMPGRMTDGLERAACHDCFVENIAWSAELAGPEGVTLILEPCCRARFPDFFYHRLDEGIAIVEAVGRPNVKLCFDTFHVQTEEGALTERLERVWPHVGHIQVGNVPGRHEPGTGEIHFPYLFQRIEALGWNGWVGCEYTPSAATLDTLQWGRPFGIGT